MTIAPLLAPVPIYARGQKFHHHPSLFDIRDFKNQRHGRQPEGKKSNRFNKQNSNFAHAPHFFVHFFPVFAQL